MKIPVYLGECLGEPLKGSFESRRDTIQNAVRVWVRENYGKRTYGYVTATFADSVIVSLDGVLDPTEPETHKSKHVRFPYSLDDGTAELGDPMEVELQTVITTKKKEAEEALAAMDVSRLVESTLELRRLETLKEVGTMGKLVKLNEFFTPPDGRGANSGMKGRKSRTSTSGTTHSGGISGASDGRAVKLNKSSARSSRTATSGTTHGGGTGPDGRDPGQKKSSKRGAGGRSGPGITGQKTGSTGDDATVLTTGIIKPEPQATRGKGALESLADQVTAILMGKDPDSSVNEAVATGELSYKEIAAQVEGNPEIAQRLKSLDPEYANAKFRNIQQALEAVGARFYEDDEIKSAISNGLFDPDWVAKDEE